MMSPYDKPSTRQRKRYNNSSSHGHHAHHKRRPNTGLAYNSSHQHMEHAMHALTNSNHKGNSSTHNIHNHNLHHNGSGSYDDSHSLSSHNKHGHHGDSKKFLLDINRSSGSSKNSSTNSSSSSHLNSVYTRARENMRSSGSSSRKYISDFATSMGAGNTPDPAPLSSMFRSLSRKGLRGSGSNSNSNSNSSSSSSNDNSNSFRRGSSHHRDIGGAGSGIHKMDHRSNNSNSNSSNSLSSRPHSGMSQSGLSLPEIHHMEEQRKMNSNNYHQQIQQRPRRQKKINHNTNGNSAQDLDLQDISGLHCGVCTIKGLKPGNPKWQNQDNFVIAENINKTGNIHLYGVFDGHGELGHLVSQRIREELPKHLINCNLDPVKACKIMQKNLHETPFDCSCSGATCILTIQSGNHLKVGNLGDSRCVLGRIINGLIVSVPLSRDHKPDRPDEHQRIVACGGQVGCRQIILSQRTSNAVALPMGPPRLWYQARGETMGLAMSRSLGDTIVHTVGGSSEAEIMEHTIECNDKFMILASDGIWDVVDNNQACQIVYGYIQRTGASWSTTEAANLLSRFARHRWQTVSNMIDDITCMVVKLKQE